MEKGKLGKNGYRDAEGDVIAVGARVERAAFMQ